MINGKEKLKERLKGKIDQLPEEQLYDVSDFLESIKKDINISKILSFAGAWSDIDDEVFNELIKNFDRRSRSNRQRII